MAIWIVKNNGKISYGIKRYLCDTLEDLPYSENGEVVIPGSKAYVISEKKTYMMGSDEEWHEINEGSGASSMSQLTDVDLTNLEDGQVLKYDEDTQTWKPGNDASATSLGNLDDVDLTGLQDGQVIIYDSTTEKWLASNIPSDIAEVTQAQYDILTTEQKNNGSIYQISNKGYFYYKGKQFRASRELTQAEFDALPTSEKNNGTEYLITDATTSINDIDDVSISGATDGQSLYYDATLGVWKNSAGKIVYAEIDDVLDTGETSITLTSNYITTDSVIDVFIDDDFDGVTYDSLVIADGSVTLTFPEQANNMPVMIRVWIDGYGAANNIEIDDDHALPDVVWSGEKIQEEIINIYEQITNLYDNTATYNVGDTVIYNNTYYENITQITVPEDFDPNKWNEINLEERLAEKVDNTEFADKYSETSTYQEGDVVIYNNKFYINITPISAPGEAWDPTHWQSVTLADLVMGHTQVQSDWNESDSNDPAYIKNKPTIPAAQVQSDWNESDTSDPSYIQNKPSIPNNINDLGNVDTTGATDGQLLGYNGTTDEWVPVTGGGGGATTLAALTDTSISNPTAGQGLIYNATSGKWENGAIGGGGTASATTYNNTTSGLNATNVQDAIDELKSIINSLINMLGDTYDPTSSYSVGDKVIYNNNYYICNTDIPAPGEAWNSSHWTLTNITGQLPSGYLREVVL